MAENTVKLTCSDCGGTMDIDADKKVLLCPFCGSKKIILESDEVKIAKIQADADVEKARMEHESEMRRQEYDNEEQKRNDKEENIILIVVGIFLIVMIAVFVAMIFK